MNDLDYESLFNQILIKSRDRRRSLKADLDQQFDVDPRATADILHRMIEAVDRAGEIDGVRTHFQEILKRLRKVRLNRDELVAKVDELYGSMRSLLELKEDLADGPLDTLTALFREELGNQEFKFTFNVIDERELDALSTFRQGPRATPARATPPPPERAAMPEPEPPPPPRMVIPDRFETPVRPEPPRAVPPPPPPAPVVDDLPGEDFDLSPVMPEPEPELTPDPEPEPEPLLETTMEESGWPEESVPMPEPEPVHTPRFQLHPVVDEEDEAPPRPVPAPSRVSDLSDLEDDLSMVEDIFQPDPPPAPRPAAAKPAVPKAPEPPAPDPADDGSYEVEVDVLKILSDD